MERNSFALKFEIARFFTLQIYIFVSTCQTFCKKIFKSHKDNKNNAWSLQQKKTFFASSAAENFVLGSLLAQGFHLPHYWSISGNKAEVDFLIQDGIDVRPVEVKAEGNISGQSLKVYQEKYNPKLRVRFSMKNLNINGNILNIPIFLCDWLKSILDFASERMTD